MREVKGGRLTKERVGRKEKAKRVDERKWNAKIAIVLHVLCGVRRMLRDWHGIEYRETDQLTDFLSLVSLVRAHRSSILGSIDGK